MNLGIKGLDLSYQQAKPPRQKFFKFLPPLQGKGIFNSISAPQPFPSHGGVDFSEGKRRGGLQ
jgi:hypothetical protein